MFEMFLELATFVMLAVVAHWVGISIEAAEISLVHAGFVLMLWVCFRSALRDARKRQRLRHRL
jgi:hypothetical protein